MPSDNHSKRLRIAVVGAGAVGGYFGALLARAGHDLGFIARGAHGDAIQRKGLTIRRFDGEFTVRAPATSNPAELGPADLVLLAVKSYDNASALPLLAPLVGSDTTVLTLQNGVDAPEEAASVVGRDVVVGGAAYIATAVVSPGTIEQTGNYQRIALGEVFRSDARVSDRVARMAAVLNDAGIEALPAADGRVQLWEKFIYLAPMSGVTGAARQPLGVVRADPVSRQQLFAAIREVEAVARAEGVPVAPDIVHRLSTFVDGVPATMRSSLLIDLSLGRRIEVESLQGSVVRRAARLGVAVPIMETLYAVLRAAASVLPSQ
jgi:2-dehydropantoate 2-reductase